MELGQQCPGAPAVVQPGVTNLTVSGCADPTIGLIVRGEYAADAENHGRTVFRKDVQVNGMDVLIYFWDSRDGPSLHGWWLAPKIGGDAVWAHNPITDSPLPPAKGWRVPYNGPPDPTLTVTCRPPTVAGMKRPAELAPLPGLPPEKQPAFAQVLQQALQQTQDLASQQAAAAAAAREAQAKEAQRQLAINRQREEQRRAEELRRQKEQEEQAKAMLLELNGLVAAAEAECAGLKEKAKLLEDLRDLGDDDVIGRAGEVEACGAKTKAAHKVCTDFILGKQLNMTEPLRQDLLKLLMRINESTRDADVIVNHAKSAMETAQENKDRVVRKASALKAAAKQSGLFTKYDKDADGLLNGPELVEFAKGEYKFDLPQDRVDRILAELAVGQAGVPSEHFPRLRTMIGIAREEAKNRQRRQQREEQERAERQRKEELAAQAAQVQQAVADALVAMESVAAEVQQAEEGVAAWAGGAGGPQAVEAAAAAGLVEAAGRALAALRGQVGVLTKDKGPLLSEQAQVDLSIIQTHAGQLDARLARASALLTASGSKDGAPEKAEAGQG